MNSIYPVKEKTNLETDRDLERILALYEIIKKYELLTEYLLSNQANKVEIESRGLHEVIVETTEKMEKEIIYNTLVSTNFNRLKAGKLLKISYKSLLMKMSKYNITGGGEKLRKKLEYVGV